MIFRTTENSCIILNTFQETNSYKTDIFFYRKAKKDATHKGHSYKDYPIGITLPIS